MRIIRSKVISGTSYIYFLAEKKRFDLPAALKVLNIKTWELAFGEVRHVKANIYLLRLHGVVRTWAPEMGNAQPYKPLVEVFK